MIDIPAINSIPTITGICWSPDGKQLAVTGNTVYLYTVKKGSSGTPKQLTSFYTVPLKSQVDYDYKGCIFSDESTLFVFKRYHGSKKSTIVKYHVGAGKYATQVKESNLVVGAYHTIHDLDEKGERLAFGTVNGDVIVVSCKTLEVLCRTKAHSYCVTGLCFVRANLDEEVVVSCGLDKRLTYTNLKSQVRWDDKRSFHVGLVLLVLIIMLVVIQVAMN
jgi:WD40 repeat protein